jgi:hypothetical protein
MTMQPNDAPQRQHIDDLEQYVRCYTVPNDAKIQQRRRTRHPAWAKRKDARAASMGKQSKKAGMRQSHSRRVAVLAKALSQDGLAIKEIGAPYEGWCLVFDCETTTDTRQALRFGCYEIHGLDRDERIRLVRQGRLTRAALDTLHEAGLFYDPDELSPSEVELIQGYAEKHGLRCLTRDEFVEPFYYWMLRRDALCIGHNLPFDLSRLARCWTAADGKYRGGFTFKLCECPHDMHCFDHPPIRIKLLGRLKAKITFQKAKPLAASGRNGRASRFYATQHVPGKFLDTATLGRALLGPGDMRLRALGRRCKASKLKWKERPDLSGPLSRAQLTYCRSDVAATWALYQAERALYRRHGVKQEMWRIYSEASLGKSYKRELGVKPFLQQHSEVPADVHGYGMVGYYGGRSEVRMRLQPTEIQYCDFKSQYTTVNARMGLLELLLAKEVTTRVVTDSVRELLATLSMDQLQGPAFWQGLRTVVKLRPNEDLLPVRAEYGPEGRNIADAYLSGPPIWYALADVVASVIRTGRVPEVLEAIELVPSAEKIATKPWKLFGDERYAIDLTTQDFFTEVINLRSEIKAQLKQALAEGDTEESTYLDALQLALKLLASSTSYGILVEVNADEAVSEPQPITVYSWRTRETTTTVLERPGEFFAGAVGALIPAGGRLLLALAERLATDRGLLYAMCDTDSMALARRGT